MRIGPIPLSAFCVLAACSSSGESSSEPPSTRDAGADVETLSDAADESADAPSEVSTPETWNQGVVSVTQYEDALWNVELRDGEVVAVHQGGRVELLIDPTSSSADGRYAGVFVQSDGEERHVGSYNGSVASMFVPDRPYIDQESVEIVAEQEELFIEMLEGHSVASPGRTIRER